MVWVDSVLLGVLGLSTLVGVWRGLVTQLLSLLGWGVAYFFSRAFAPDLASRLPLPASMAWGGPHVNAALSFGLLFLLSMVLWGILSWLIGQLVRASPLSGADRLLGGVFGLARGVFILLVLATLVGLTPLQQAPAWQQSQGAAVLGAASGLLRPLLPPEVAPWLPVAGHE